MGRNGQGKTNLLEAAYYPVLLRSFRGATDSELVAFNGAGFHVEAVFDGEAAGSLTATFLAAGRKKRIAVDDVEERRLTAAIGRWLAVVFLPGDVELAGGPAAGRRRFLDRMLSLAEPALPAGAAAVSRRAVPAECGAAAAAGRRRPGLRADPGGGRGAARGAPGGVGRRRGRGLRRRTGRARRIGPRHAGVRGSRRSSPSPGPGTRPSLAVSPRTGRAASRPSVRIAMT